MAQGPNSRGIKGIPFQHLFLWERLQRIPLIDNPGRVRDPRGRRSEKIFKNIFPVITGEPAKTKCIHSTHRTTLYPRGVQESFQLSGLKPIVSCLKKKSPIEAIDPHFPPQSRSTVSVETAPAASRNRVGITPADLIVLSAGEWPPPRNHAAGLDRLGMDRLGQLVRIVSGRAAWRSWSGLSSGQSPGTGQELLSNPDRSQAAAADIPARITLKVLQC